MQRDQDHRTSIIKRHARAYWSKVYGECKIDQDHRTKIIKRLYASRLHGQKLMENAPWLKTIQNMNIKDDPTMVNWVKLLISFSANTGILALFIYLSLSSFCVAKSLCI